MTARAHSSAAPTQGTGLAGGSPWPLALPEAAGRRCCPRSAPSRGWKVLLLWGGMGKRSPGAGRAPTLQHLRPLLPRGGRWLFGD